MRLFQTSKLQLWRHILKIGCFYKGNVHTTKINIALGAPALINYRVYTKTYESITWYLIYTALTCTITVISGHMSDCEQCWRK